MNDAFENSIRSKLNEADIPFDQDAWSKMESLLDAGDKKRPAAWRWWLLLLPLLGGIGWWILQSSSADKKAEGAAISMQKTNERSVLKGSESNETIKETNAVKPNNETVMPTGKHLPGASASSDNKSNNKTTNQNNEHLSGASASPDNKPNSKTTNQNNEHLSGASASPDNKSNNKTTNQNNEHLPGASASPDNKSNSKTTNQNNEHLPGASASPDNKPNSKTTNQNNEHLSGASASPDNKSNNKISGNPGNHLPEKNITANGSNNRDVITASGKSISIDSTSLIPSYDINFIKTKSVNNGNAHTKISHPAKIPVNTDIPADQSNSIPRRKINSKGLYIGVTLGPDLNVAPSLNYGKVGFNAGVLAHYYFNRRWFVTTGAIYSKKLYGATSKDYTAWTNGSAPYDLVRVNANCDVLDIPVNMNYTFLQVNNNTVSATLGLSNYFMLKEQYQYLYKTSPEWEKTVQNENQHYLAILNVGALYQHPAGRRLIVGVQPYAKIPLRGVGLGQVKLYSAGVSFQLNLVGKKR